MYFRKYLRTSGSTLKYDTILPEVHVPSKVLSYESTSVHVLYVATCTVHVLEGVGNERTGGGRKRTYVLVPFQRARLPASPHKNTHITAIAIIRAHRGRDFACGRPCVRELRAPTVRMRRHWKKTEKTRTTAKITPKNPTSMGN